MPTGLYGSPELGPYRRIREQRSGAQRLGELVTLDPIWRRVVPWRRPRTLLRGCTLLAWVAFGLLMAPGVISRVSAADLPVRARSVLHLDATPTAEAARSEAVAPLITPFTGVRARAPQIALVASSCTSSGQPGVTTCRGSVRNIAGRNLSGLQVTLGWSATGNGESQLANSASIDVDPLLPGQVSSWVVIGRYNAALPWYHIKVIDSLGNELPLQDERPPAPSNAPIF